MSKVPELLKYNEAFVNNHEYEQYLSDRFPEKKMVIVTCMDARLVELLPRAMNLRNGDAKLIKNAGAIITSPFGNIMRSVLVAVYELKAKEVIVVGHHECGMTGLNSDAMVEKMKQSGISDNVFLTLKHSGIELNRWLKGFDSVHESVINSANIVRNHPLLPKGILVQGMIIHPETGKLEWISRDEETQ